MNFLLIFSNKIAKFSHMKFTEVYFTKHVHIFFQILKFYYYVINNKLILRSKYSASAYYNSWH